MILPFGRQERPGVSLYLQGTLCDPDTNAPIFEGDVTYNLTVNGDEYEEDEND